MCEYFSVSLHEKGPEQASNESQFSAQDDTLSFICISVCITIFFLNLKPATAFLSLAILWSLSLGLWLQLKTFPCAAFYLPWGQPSAKGI